jgi:hypothetical protein
MVRKFTSTNFLAILNICYEKENVKHVIRSGCIETILSYIAESKDMKLLAACAGAIQSVVCMQLIISNACSAFKKKENNV